MELNFSAQPALPAVFGAPTPPAVDIAVSRRLAGAGATTEAAVAGEPFALELAQWMSEVPLSAVSDAPTPPPVEIAVGRPISGAGASMGAAVTGEPFALELAQWMSEGALPALPAGLGVEVADDAGEIAPEIAASEERAADPAAMIWMILGLQKPEAPKTRGASIDAPPADSALAAQALPAQALGLRPERPAQVRQDRTANGSVMPSLPATASPVASAALATAFARHLELAPALDSASLPLNAALDALTAAGAAGSGDIATAPAAPPALAGTPMIERINSLTAGLIPAEVLDPLTPQAPQQIAETVVWHLGKGEQEVRIRLNPKDLGQIDVSIKLEGEHVDVRFDAADASVRDVVQTSLPQLASLLSARGLTLDQAQVFSQSRGQQNSAAPEPERRSSAEGSAEIGTVTETRRILRRGLVDDYV